MLNQEPMPRAGLSLQGRIPEILAPAGGRAQFFAALNAGADAVYLGMQAFNARARAENFTPDDLRELVPLAHAYGMRVLVTLNILIKELELDDLVRTMATLEELEVDAIIVQDLGVARIARQYFPGLRLHASTQLAVHNLAGVERAVAQGFRRVVLARELTHQEIKRIRAAFSRETVEIEAFCHGSLCYSYSGLCFFSGAEDARSGNRGECAYTCRQPYKILNEPGHGFLFSMRDLDTSQSLELLAAAGVDTLKIEGRKKDAQYVASTVRLYRERLDEVYGRPTLRASAPKRPLDEKASLAQIYEDLSLSFRRRPTSFFLKGRYVENVIDLDNPTHRGIEVGTVERVQGRRFTVRAQCALERFDGLRIEESARAYHSRPQDGDELKSDGSGLQRRYENERIEFSLRKLAVRGKTCFEAKEGSLVEIELPEDVRTQVAVGDRVYKIRSADLKRRIEALAQAPQDYKLKKQRLVAVHVSVDTLADGLKIAATVTKFGEVVCRASRVVLAERPRGEAKLAQDLASLFSVFGEAGFTATRIDVTGDDLSWFVPRSLLKDVKHALSEDLPRAYEDFLDRRLERARQALVTPLDASVAENRVAASRVDRRFSLKTDRLEALAHLARRAKELQQVEELVFEPKRAFLAELRPDTLAEALAAAAAESGVKVRLAMPTVVRAWDEPLLQRWFKAAHQVGITAYEIGNIGAFKLLETWGLPGDDLASDFTMYLLNSSASTQWREAGVSTMCLSVEDDLKNVRAHMARLPASEREHVQAILYKDTPLFIAEACSLTALHDGCPTSKVCGYRTLEIENPSGERFYVAHESCKSIVYGRDAYGITQRQDELLKVGVKRFRIDFLTRPYDSAQMDAVIDAALAGKSVPETHTANFDRTLL